MLEKLLYDLPEADDWLPKRVEACCEVRCCPSNLNSSTCGCCVPSGTGGGFTQTVGPGPSNTLVNFPGGPTLTFTSTNGRTMLIASINQISSTESAFFQFEVDGTLVGPVWTNPSGIDTITLLFTTTLSAGTHTVSVRVTNGAGVTTVIGSAANSVGGWLAVNAC